MPRVFELWCEEAEASAARRLKQMPKTIRKPMKGLLGFRNHGRIVGASQEGLNNAIEWLTRHACGHRDEAFLHLKIHDLPNLSMRKQL